MTDSSCASGAHTDSSGALSAAWARLAKSVLDAPVAPPDDASARPRTDVELAEGYDYWAQVLTFALRRELHYGDGRHPMFHRIGFDTKIGFDNPDNVYEIAKIDPRQTYQVRGTRGSAQFLEFSTSVGFPGVVTPPRTVSKLDTTELDIEPDGTIQLVVGGPPRPRNWLAVDRDTTSVLVRQVFGEWRPDDQPGDFRITSNDIWDGSPTAVPDPIELSERITATANFVETQTRYWLDYIEGLRTRISPNSFERPGLQGKELVAVNAARAYFCWGIFQLADDEALIVEVDAPEPDSYLGFHLVNYWLQSLDYVGRITSLNGSQVHVDSDERIRYVLAHRDPGVPNWLDVQGHPWGGMLFRTALTSVAAQPTATVVRWENVRAALPPNMPVVDAATRQAQVRARRAHVAARFRW